MYRFAAVAVVALVLAACGALDDEEDGSGGAIGPGGSGGTGGDGDGGSPATGGSTGAGGTIGTGGTLGTGGDGGAVSSCGDGIANEGEECDGTDLRGLSCTDLAFDGGVLGCSFDCTLDTSDCFAIEICDDGLDNDGDGDTDCDDSDCDQVAPCPICGNGVVEGDEACDDGNLDEGDGCSSACEIEPWYLVPTMALTSTRSGSLDSTDPQYTRLIGCGSPSNHAPNYYDVHYLQNPSSGAVDVRVDATWGGDGYLFAYTDFDPSNQTVGCVDGQHSLGNLARVHATVPGNGGIYIVSTSFDVNDALGPYTLTAVTLDVCGDGLTTAAEQCDFGDTADGDGCSSFCQVEDGWVCDATGCRQTVCGDGVVEGSEHCDGTPGCGTDCRILPGWVCDDTSCWQTVCGDGTVEGSEQCDDGGLQNGDGCDSTCAYELVVEQEPNDAPPDATPFVLAGTGALDPYNESDYWSIQVTAGVRYTATTGGRIDRSCDSIWRHDTYLRVYDDTGTLLGEDDDSAEGWCALVSFTASTTGTYYLRVSTRSRYEHIAQYFVFIDETP